MNLVDPTGLYSSDFWNRLNDIWFRDHGFNASVSGWGRIDPISEFERPIRFRFNIGDNYWDEYWFIDWGLPQSPAYPPPRPDDRRHMLDDCHFLAATAEELAAKSLTDTGFVGALKERFVPPSNQDSPAMREFRSGGFKGRFNDDQGSYNQVRHFVGAFSNAYYGGLAAALGNINYGQAVREAVNQALKREGATEYSDKRLSAATVPEAVALAYDLRDRKNIGKFIRENICGKGW